MFVLSEMELWRSAKSSQMCSAKLIYRNAQAR
jgi:hypothetical protein